MPHDAVNLAVLRESRVGRFDDVRRFDRKSVETVSV